MELILKISSSYRYIYIIRLMCIAIELNNCFLLLPDMCFSQCPNDYCLICITNREEFWLVSSVLWLRFNSCPEFTNEGNVRTMWSGREFSHEERRCVNAATVSLRLPHLRRRTAETWITQPITKIRGTNDCTLDMDKKNKLVTFVFFK